MKRVVMRNVILPFALFPLAIAMLAVNSAPSQTASEQSLTPQWEIAAGGKMAFDVASIKRHPYDPASRVYYPRSNFPLDSSDLYKPTGGLLSTEDRPVLTYISFAYKLTADQSERLTYPKWAANEHFDIEARGPENATKDQMRLMMQSLLADRFKMTVHWETREVPVFKVVLAKSGKLGPDFESYSGPECPDGTPAPKSNPKLPFGICGRAGMQEQPDREWKVIGRSMPIQQLVSTLARWAGTGIDRPLIDGTGLSGAFDYVLTFAPEAQPGQPQADGPSCIEALRDQLGLKLEPDTAMMNFLMIDHIEEPTAN